MKRYMKKRTIHRSKKGKKGILLLAVLAALFITGCGNSAATEGQTETVETESDLTAAKVGSLITFGHYEQDNDTSNGKEPIEWIVVEKREDGGLLVMSRYALDVQPFNVERISVSWRTCTLREWLNGSFLNTAFSPDELAMISTDNTWNAENSPYEANSEDLVFLFSKLEVREYFADDADGDCEARTCESTAYAKAQGVWTSEGGYDGKCRWWLRSLGDDTTNAAFVGINGRVYDLGRMVNREDLGIRPAMVIKP